MSRARRAASFVVVVVLLALSPALAADVGSATKALKDAVAKDDAKGIEDACHDLVASAGKESLAPILGLVTKAEGATYWRLVSAAGGFRDEPALEELGKFVVAHAGDARSPSADLVFVLGTNGAPAVVKPLAYVLEKGRLDLELMAADALAALRSAEAVAALEAQLTREKKDGELRRRVESALEAAKDDSAKKVRDHELGRTVERVQDSQVLVLSADRTGAGTDERDNDFDRIQTILEGHKLPHRVVKKFEFEKDPQRYLEGCRALLVNCNRISPYCACPKCGEAPLEGEGANRLAAGCNPKCSVHQTVCYKLSDKTLAAVKAWVEEKGGFLYTEDWGVLDVVGRAWPERAVAAQASGSPRLVRVRAKDGKSWLPSFNVKLRPARGAASHPFMRGVWQRAAPAPPKAEAEGETTERPPEPGHVFEHDWQIDDEAPAISVVDPASVTVLLESEELARVAGGEAAVAITFRPGVKPPAVKQATGSDASRATGEWTRSKSGRVLHTISHFGHQDTKADGQALENLLLNFLLEASKQHEVR